MIQCPDCGPQFVQITKSRVYFENGSTINEVSERFECTLCGNTGELEIWEEGNTRRTSITGEIEATDDEPRVSP